MTAPKKDTKTRQRAAAAPPTERYEMLRPQLVSHLADGMSYAKIAAAMGISRVMTVWEWAQKPEIAPLVTAERQKRLADAEHLRAAKLQDAHEFAWKVATGKEQLKTPEQREMLRYFLGWDAERMLAPQGETSAAAEAQAGAAAVTHVTVNIDPEAIRRPIIEPSE